MIKSIHRLHNKSIKPIAAPAALLRLISSLGQKKMINKFRIIVFLLLIAAVSIPTTVLAESGKEMTELLGVKLGKAMTLSDVQKLLGSTRMVETGEAGEYRATVCYYIPSCSIKVAFWSGMNLVGIITTQLALHSRALRRTSRSCRKLTNINCSALGLANGIQMGMHLNDYKGILGDGIEFVEGYYQKAFVSHRPMTEKERSSISKELSSQLPAGLIWDISVFVRGAFGADGLGILECLFSGLRPIEAPTCQYSRSLRSG